MLLVAKHEVGVLETVPHYYFEINSTHTALYVSDLNIMVYGIPSSRVFYMPIELKMHCAHFGVFVNAIFFVIQ